ncbi:MAG: class I SAM-dependent methyltransferase [Thiohalocapsa sp. PB-PSB1]|jgi:ubiquinone/menaquinone biosynthesis C-methylase UbiE|nr:MAG: hypothetical protein N838_25735 [Thiohalocapsa sp. PB-PSB1]QQO56963.1 MAG: class I SAM-dependent methyltransferase [Thiohalocapsa sp. PB-PSB1]HCS89817.1 class I SAM-dependent methyltransferase [Chromatiaceae bacterium]
MTNRFPKVPDQPRLYDWMYRKTDKDVAMYRQFTECHAEILEIAVGTGRLAIPLAEAGRVVHGIDDSAAMLGLCRDKLEGLDPRVSGRIHLYQVDMREFDLGRQFDFVFIPFASIVYLLSIEDQQACLRTLKRHLGASGTLVIDFPTWAEARDEHWLDNDQLLRKERRMEDPNSGKLVELWTQNRYDAATQILEQDRHFRTYDTDGNFEGEKVVLWRSRVFTPGEFQLLLQTCGLKLVEMYGDFQFGPFHHDSEVAVAVIGHA